MTCEPNLVVGHEKTTVGRLRPPTTTLRLEELNGDNASAWTYHAEDEEVFSSGVQQHGVYSSAQLFRVCRNSSAVMESCTVFLLVSGVSGCLRSSAQGCRKRLESTDFLGGAG